uniref:Uncharacterized protein n=1 Tax=Scleropages formosus TaxID=113540 RepID=A0A8C9QTM2_SCLFO
VPGKVEGLTCDFHHPVFGFHHQLLGGKVVHIQADLPEFWGLLDLRHAAAQLARQSAGVRRRHCRGCCFRRGGWRPQIAWPVGARPVEQLLREDGHPEGLVEEAAAVPVPEGVPAGRSQEGEGNASLGHPFSRRVSSPS